MYHRRDRRIGLYFCYTLTKMCACKLSHYSRNAILLFRIPEALYVIITAGIAFALVSSNLIIPSSRMQIPDINFSNGGSNFIAQNPVNSYPIRLSGFTCYAPELNACIITKQSGAAMSQGCCAELYDSSVEPYQQISNPLLWILAIIIPFLLFIVRAAIWRCYIGRQWCSHSLMPANSVLSLQSVLLYIFSIPPQTLEQLLILHYASIQYGSGDLATMHASYSTLGMTLQEKKKQCYPVGNDLASTQRNGEINNTKQREDLSYEIIDSAGNSIGRPREIENASGMADPVSIESQSDSFLTSKLGLPGPTAAPSPLQHMFWLLLLYEPSAGLAISLVFQGIICQALKRYVGAPRPNYYALSAWASVYDNRAVDAISAQMSFPSGHSATAAAGLGFVVLVLLNDVRKLKSRHWRLSMQDGPSVSTASVIPTGIDGAEDRVLQSCDTMHLIITFTLVSMLCVCVAFMIGGSRIRDYFHFAPDVIAGWLIGTLTAGLTYSFTARSSTRGPGLHGGATDMVHASLL